MATLTTSKRNSLPSSSFVFPATRSYPIHDESHARNALARVSQFGSPSEQSAVRAAVARRYPGIAESKPKVKKKVSEQQAQINSLIKGK